MSKKNTIRLTESDLKKVISESVKKVLMESNESDIEKQINDIVYTAKYITKSNEEDGVAYCIEELLKKQR